MKRYLSFDVCIKNLAYCKITEDRVIEDWGIINLNENPQCDVHLNKWCEKQSKYEVKNNEKIKYSCTVQSKKFPKKKKINTNHNLMKISQLAVGKLRELDLNGITHVLIENQTALKNPVMKSIQMIIYTFFVMDGVMTEDSSIETIHMVNARNKLKVYKGPPIECNKKDKYAQNKYLSVEYTKEMIKGDDEKFIKLFDESKKKDDLADAYLQGIYWIEK